MHFMIGIIIVFFQKVCLCDFDAFHDELLEFLVI